MRRLSYSRPVLAVVFAGALAFPPGAAATSTLQVDPVLLATSAVELVREAEAGVRDAVFRDAALVLAWSGLGVEAAAVAVAVRDPKLRADALAAAADALWRAGQREEALRLLRADGGEPAYFAALGREWGVEPELRRLAAPLVQGWLRRRRALVAVARELVAEDRVEEAELLIRSEADRDRRDQVRLAVLEALTRWGYQEALVQVAERVEGGRRRDGAFEIVAGLALYGTTPYGDDPDPGRALVLAARIRDPTRAARFLAGRAVEMARRDRTVWAVRFARLAVGRAGAVRPPARRVEVWSDVCEAFARAGQMSAARQAAREAMRSARPLTAAGARRLLPCLLAVGWLEEAIGLTRRLVARDRLLALLDPSLPRDLPERTRASLHREACTQLRHVLPGLPTEVADSVARLWADRVSDRDGRIACLLRVPPGANRAVALAAVIALDAEQDRFRARDQGGSPATILRHRSLVGRLLVDLGRLPPSIARDFAAASLAVAAAHVSGIELARRALELISNPEIQQGALVPVASAFLLRSGDLQSALSVAELSRRPEIRDMILSWVGQGLVRRGAFDAALRTADRIASLQDRTSIKLAVLRQTVRTGGPPGDVRRLLAEPEIRAHVEDLADMLVDAWGPAEALQFGETLLDRDRFRAAVAVRAVATRQAGLEVAAEVAQGITDRTLRARTLAAVARLHLARSR